MIRKIISGLAIIAACHSAWAQKSFEKGVNVVSVGGDLGVYQYTSVVKSTGKIKNDGAANKMLNLQYERGILNWLGGGIKLQYCNYFTSTDSTTKTRPSVTSFDAALVVNAHVVRTRRIDLLAGINLGYTHLTYSANDQNISQAKGGGTIFDMHVQPRFYFGEHIGMFVNLAYVYYGYGSLDFQNTQTKVADAMSLKGGGINFGLGVQAKF